MMGCMLLISSHKHSWEGATLTNMPPRHPRKNQRISMITISEAASALNKREPFSGSDARMLGV